MRITFLNLTTSPKKENLFKIKKRLFVSMTLM